MDPYLSQLSLTDALIASGVRTPIGKFGKSLRTLPATRLGAFVVREAVRRAGLKPADVDEVIMGNVLSAGLGQNPARQAAVHAGIPYEIGALTVNKVCGSGLKAVMLAAQAIKAGDADVVVAGGMESMSNAPFLSRDTRWGLKYGDSKTVDSMISDGLWDAYNDFHMGMTGEIIAERFKITRREADEFSLSSQKKAAEAIVEKRFAEEILSLEVNGGNNGDANAPGMSRIFSEDECVRKDTSLKKLSMLEPVFKNHGVLTAGNSSHLSDGASALVLVSKKKAKELSNKPLSRVVSYEVGGTKPELVMEAPISTVKSLIRKSKIADIDHFDLVEHNEAYATASLAVASELGIDMKRLNIKGGAIALGHPIGCSGARILVTLLHSLKERNLDTGLATLCLGGGNAVAMAVERV